jgi:PAS domain S-box-containing protein
VLCLLAWAVVRRDRSEARYRDLLEQAGDGICILDRSGRVLEANRAAIAMLALGDRGPDPRAFVELVDEDQRDQWVAALAALGAGQRTEREWTLRRADGRRLHTDVSLARVGRNRLLAIIRDISDRRALEEQLRQSQKMEAVGRLAGGIAHDFNNLLTAILGYTDLLIEGLADDDGRRADATEVRRSAERATELTRQLLAFSRKQVLQPRVLDLNGLVTGTSGMLRRLIGEQIRYELRISPGLWLVEADPHQIEQVLVNLVLNARDAMPQGGTLTIETANVEACPGDRQGLAPGPYVMLAVHDTGHGIDDSVRPHLFEPFFTTRPVGRGTGLGLPTAQGIVRQSGGDILVESQPGAGASFRVYLPRTSKTIAPAEAPADATEPPGADAGSETVLLVEDDASVRTLMREGLARRGYRVIDVEHPAEALKVAATHSGTLHALVSDVVMPNTSGPVLARQLLEMRPTLRILFVSGYPSDLLDLDGRHLPFTAFLSKPFDAETVAAKLRELLDARLPR